MKHGKAFDDKRRRRRIKGEKVLKGRKCRRTRGLKMKVLCMTCIVRTQRDANITVENIVLASEIVLHLARDARPVEL